MTRMPGDLPDPPADLAKRRLVTVEAAFRLRRIHRCALEPIYFGRAGGTRFVAPGGEYGVLYAGRDAYGAFAEVFGDTWASEPATPGWNVLPEAVLHGWCLVTLIASRPLLLCDLRGSGLARIGADARLCSGSYAVAGRWALALWAHPRHVDGLLYRSRHDDDTVSVALFNRCSEILTAGRSRQLDQIPELTSRLLRRYSVALLP